MIFNLIETIKDKIVSANLDYVDKLAGLTTVNHVNKQNSATTTVQRSYPTYCGLNDTCEQSKLVPLIPDNKLRSLIYFERVGDITNLKSYSKLNNYSATVRLVGWLNPKGLGVNDCDSSGKVINELISLIESKTYNSGDYLKVKIEVGNIKSREQSIFSKYSYSDKFITLLDKPYEYFSIDFDIKFSVHKDCITNLIVGTPSECEFSGEIAPPFENAKQITKDTDGNVLYTDFLESGEENERVIQNSTITNSNGSFNDTVLAEGDKVLSDVNNVDSDGTVIPTAAQTPFIAKLCGDATETFNGSSISNIPSGGNKDIIVRDSVTLLSIGSKTTDTPTSLIVDVTAGATYPISYVRDNWRFAPTQNILHDLRWHIANKPEMFNYVLEGVKPVLSHTDETKLLTLNEKGNYERVTNSLGNQVYDGSDGSINNYCIDHYTGLGLPLSELIASGISWVTSNNTIQTFSALGFDDWRMFTLVDAYNIATGNGISNILKDKGMVFTELYYFMLDSVSSSSIAYWSHTVSKASNAYQGVVPPTTNYTTIGTLICRNHYN